MTYDKNVGLQPTHPGPAAVLRHRHAGGGDQRPGDGLRRLQARPTRSWTAPASASCATRSPTSRSSKFYTTKRVGGGVVNFEAIKLPKISRNFNRLSQPAGRPRPRPTLFRKESPCLTTLPSTPTPAIASLLVPAVRNSDTNSTGMDLRDADDAALLFVLGDSADTLSGTNKIELEVQESDDNSHLHRRRQRRPDQLRRPATNVGTAALIDAPTEDQLVVLRRATRATSGTSAAC